MYWTKTLIPTLRESPSDAQVPSHQLMLRAGYIRRLGSGVYDYLPLGTRCLHKVMAVIREEMATAGAVEVLLPTLQPLELWERTGRRAAYGENLFVLADRHNDEPRLALGPTHEEVVTELLGGYVESYKQLPLTLYQIQTKFRDEFRPRFGVLRSREFQMKDAYSFHMDLESLDETYQAQYDAYCRIFNRCGLPYEVVEAESGPIGGNDSHEFMVPSPTGEDTILKSDKGNYAANVEKCEIGDRNHDFDGEPTGDLDDLHTPGCSGIDDVVAYCKKHFGTKLKTQNMLKCLVMVAVHENEGVPAQEAKEPWYVLAIVRSDHDVNEAKVCELMQARLSEPVKVEMAPEAMARQDGWAVGFVGPHALDGRDDTYMIVDPDAAQGGFWVTGANEADHHVKHFNWKRDVKAVADGHPRISVRSIRNAVDGDPSPKNDGGVLNETKGIEIGHVFKLGSRYAKALDVTVSDENNERQHVIMGCYGIGVNRIMAAAIERAADGDHAGGHDDNGIIWPSAIAPYQVLIIPIKYDGQVKEVTDRLWVEIEREKSPTNPLSYFHPDVLIDDRDERPGVKFKDADLAGIPIRITIGDKALKQDCVEIKPRAASQSELVAVDDTTKRVLELLAIL